MFYDTRTEEEQEELNIIVVKFTLRVIKANT